MQYTCLECGVDGCRLEVGDDANRPTAQKTKQDGRKRKAVRLTDLIPREVEIEDA